MKQPHTNETNLKGDFNMAGLLTKGITLSYKKTGSTYTEIANL
mgnify:FL=1